MDKHFEHVVTHNNFSLFRVKDNPIILKSCFSDIPLASLHIKYTNKRDMCMMPILAEINDGNIMQQSYKIIFPFENSTNENLKPKPISFVMTNLCSEIFIGFDIQRTHMECDNYNNYTRINELNIIEPLSSVEICSDQTMCDNEIQIEIGSNNEKIDNQHNCLYLHVYPFEEKSMRADRQLFDLFSGTIWIMTDYVIVKNYVNNNITKPKSLFDKLFNRCKSDDYDPLSFPQSLSFSYKLVEKMKNDTKIYLSEVRTKFARCLMIKGEQKIGHNSQAFTGNLSYLYKNALSNSACHIVYGKSKRVNSTMSTTLHPLMNMISFPCILNFDHSNVLNLDHHFILNIAFDKFKINKNVNISEFEGITIIEEYIKKLNN